MACELGQPPPAKRPPAAPTSITDIGDDLLCEIVLLLPSLPSLVRATLACRTFLHAVRSSPAFRRRFRALHPPQLLGLFIDRSSSGIPLFLALRSRSDPDLAAVVRGSDLLLTRIPEDSGDSSPGWKLESCHAGYVVLVNQAANQIAAYNPLTQALHLIPWPPGGIFDPRSPEFHIVFSGEDQRSFRMTCVQHRIWLRQPQACAALFSPDTREWQILPWVDTVKKTLAEDYMIAFCAGTQVKGFIYWKHKSQDYLLVLDTMTMQFSTMDLPLPLKQLDSRLHNLGQTKDGKLCVVCAEISKAKQGADYSNAKEVKLVVWVRRADDDGVEKWVLDEIFPLETEIFHVTGCSTEDDIRVHVVAVIDGFVYLSAQYVFIEYDDHANFLLSFCLETGKLSKLFDDTFASHFHPYFMAWPPLVCNKEDSQTNDTGESVVDSSPMGTKETHSRLVSAPQSCKFD